MTLVTLLAVVVMFAILAALTDDYEDDDPDWPR